MGKLQPNHQGNENRVLAVQAERFSGPLPPPECFQRYEVVLPGAADRILGMAERQSAHRQEIEIRDQRMEGWLSFAGLIAAFCVTMTTVLGSIWCVHSGQPVSGTILGGVGLVMIVSLFVSGRRMAMKRQAQ